VVPLSLNVSARPDGGASLSCFNCLAGEGVGWPIPIVFLNKFEKQYYIRFVSIFFPLT
jgi:hypothetical protein